MTKYNHFRRILEVILLLPIRTASTQYLAFKFDVRTLFLFIFNLLHNHKVISTPKIPLSISYIFLNSVDHYDANSRKESPATMFLIDKPFLSDFLINTIRDNKFNILANPVAKELIKDESLAWIEEEEAIALLKTNPHMPLYSNSENALAWIDQHFGESELSDQIKSLKNKVRFRELIKGLFPDFYYRQISLEDIHNLADSELPFPFVIKPAIGFFSIGVHIVRNKADWIKAKVELNAEKLKSIYPKNVLNTGSFILEEFIQGEEYAIDHYYDSEGKVVILNVLHHLFASGTDTSDRVYSTSKDIVEKHKVKFESFLNKIGKELNLKNFPAHAEVRID